MKAFYNEIDQQCCAWMSNLMDAGLITPGVICDKSIEDIAPKSLLHYDRVHMFAGIAGWELALGLSGWRPEPGSRVWTGSCPCQPFSSAGKGDGFGDERHLWPSWFHLIQQCKPDIIFGEQVASAVGHGWLDLVSADLEAEDYSIGAAVLGAHSVGAPQIRQRLYWVGDPRSSRSQGCREPSSVKDAEGRQVAGRLNSSSSVWDGEWRAGADGKVRLVKPGLELLAHGIPSRVVRLRAYGNSIVPQTAAAFIKAYASVRGGV